MNCTAVAPDTFFMEDEHGRARVHTQWGDSHDAVGEAVATCPVDCIHYVDRKQLPLLECVRLCVRGGDGVGGGGHSPCAVQLLFGRVTVFGGISLHCIVSMTGIDLRCPVHLVFFPSPLSQQTALQAPVAWQLCSLSGLTVQCVSW
jgi:ferredoxin